MTILLASTNPHKLDEIQNIWSRLGQGPHGVQLELVPLNRVDPNGKIQEPVEDQPTFESNALLKARYYAEAVGTAAIADDSGLEVDALGGRPGVRSARYAGVSGGREVVDRANNERLLRDLLEVPAPSRAARFVCAMALCFPPDTPIQGGRRTQDAAGTAPDCGSWRAVVVRGTIEGRIISPDEQPRGAHGFGYDPLFVVPALGRTTAELEPVEKNKISHRARAAGLMWKRIASLGVDPTAW